MVLVRAVHTFVAEHGDELEFSAGEEIQVLEKDDSFGDGWWRGRNTKGEEGLFPATYISESPPTPEVHNEQTDSPARVGSPPSPSSIPPDHHDVPVAEPEQISPNSRSPDPERSPATTLPEATEAAPKSGATGRFPDADHFDDTESPRAGAPNTFFETAAETVDAAANGVVNVMGKTIGEIQDAIESITKPESDHEQELGIGTNARARLAAQAKLANEHHEKSQRASGGVSGLVYSDESDEEDDHRQSLHRQSKHLPAAAPDSAPNPLAPPSALEPAFPLPATPPIGHAEMSTKPPISWTVEEVVDWAKVKGFDETMWQRFREHEITGDLLLELDANLLKELDIPQFGKRLRIAQAISELRRPDSMVSLTSADNPGSTAMSFRNLSAPPTAMTPSMASQPPSMTPPLTTPTTPSSEINHAAWSHGRRTDSIAPLPAFESISEAQPSPPATTSTSTAASMPASPVTPSSTSKRESTGSLSHKKGKPSIDKQERLSFFNRGRKPAPSTLSSGDGLAPAFSTNQVHQMQPASPVRKASATPGPGSAKAVRQIGTPDYSGYLKKKGDRYSSWKTRFFVLKGSHLYYMNGETEDRVKGHIDVRGYRVIVDENTNPGSYGFRLVGPDKPHAFSSSEQMAVRAWMKALMKATIARDYSVPVTSSCNIPTIPLAEAQALAPRPPSPATRDATQRATRRENTNQLTAHDASVLVSCSNDSPDEQMSLDTTSGQRRRSRNMSVPSRPTRDNRRPSATMTRPDVSRIFERHSRQVASVYPEDSNEWVQWVNSVLPPVYPRATSFPGSFVSGEVIFLLVRSVSGLEPNPPVPPNAFATESDGLPGLSGLFSTMDILIDAGIDTAGVSINEIRLGDAGGILRLLQSVRTWADHRAGMAH